MVDRLRRERRRFIQVLLRASLVAATMLMGTGLIVWAYSDLEVASAVQPGDLFSQIDLGNRLMLAGIALLAITPVLRVFALLVLWARERAWRFVATSGAVLALLAIAYLLGAG